MRILGMLCLAVCCSLVAASAQACDYVQSLVLTRSAVFVPTVQTVVAAPVVQAVVATPVVQTVVAQPIILRQRVIRQRFVVAPVVLRQQVVRQRVVVVNQVRSVRVAVVRPRPLLRLGR